MYNYKLFEIALKIGGLMLSYGAEIFRAEESIVRICKAYGVKEIDVFAIPSNIIVTFYSENDEPCTLSKKIKQRKDDFDKIDKLNSLSRYICENTPDVDTINKSINNILSRKHYNKGIITFCYAIIPAIFCLFFGGNLKDAFFSMFIGIVIMKTLNFLQKYRANLIFTNIICSALASIISILFVMIGFGDNYDKMIIGSIMLLVPGIILTNAMRDIMLGDIMTGILGLIETFLVASGLAIGVVLILTLFRNII